LTQKEHEQIAEICQIEYSLADFSKNATPVGMFTYPFKMQLPAWLPHSIQHFIKEGSLEIFYELRVYYGTS